MPAMMADGGTPSSGDDGGGGGGMTDAVSITPPVNDADMPSTDAAPGGPWVAFVSSSPTGFRVYLVHDDGKDLHAIVTSGNSLAPAWSPDGTKLAFESTHGSDAGAYGLFVVDVASDTISPLPTGLSDAVSPAWSPDGTQIAFGGAGGLYLVPAQGGTATPLTTGTFRDNTPAWSPDGTVIYFSSNRAPDGSFDVWSVTPDAGTPVQVTTGTGILGGPAVSPDGTTIAFAQQGTSTTQVAFFTLATKTTTVFTAQGDYEPAFSPSGTTLAVTSTRYDIETPSVVLLGIPDASAPFRLTPGGGTNGQGTFQPKF